jgi:hypothetical protein
MKEERSKQKLFGCRPNAYIVNTAVDKNCNNTDDEKAIMSAYRRQQR